MKSSTDERLLQATLKLISEKGYLKATTKDIAREAGVTEITLFRHFGSKERLFEEVINKYTFLPPLRDLLSEISKYSYSYEKGLHAIGVLFFETLKERKSLVKIMTSEINIYPEKVREIYTQFIDETDRILAGYFRSQQKKGMLRRFLPEMAAGVFFGMIFSCFRLEEIVKGRDVRKKELDGIIKGFVEIFVHGTLKGERDL